MKVESFMRSDGTEGARYKLEAGDELTCRFDHVGMTEKAVVLKSGKPTIIKNYFIGVSTSDGKEITLSLTEAQADQLKKAEKQLGSVKDKIILGRSYKNKYGDQIGLSIKDVFIKD